MKGNGFMDRTRHLEEWFQDCNSCEQTIVLYSLLTKVSATQARFLSFVLEHSVKNGCDSQELSKLEMQANSSSFLKSLHHGHTEEQVLSQLLTHLPLVNPGNAEVRAEYMKLLPKVIRSSSHNELDYVDKCRQLLSLAMVHPAFPHEDRDQLSYLLKQLDTKQQAILGRQAAVSSPQPQQQQQQPDRPPPIPPRIRQIKTDEDMGLFSTNGRIYIEGDLNSLHETTDPYNADDEEIPSSSSRTLQPRQASLQFIASDHTSPVPASFEETGFREKANTVPRVGVKEDSLQMSTITGGVNPEDWKAGMKDVPVWLKSHRLHKYQPLFGDLAYEQMLEMNESYLESKHVTKGARTKLILCIRKLARRPETLQEIEQDMEKHGHLLQCFNELRLMLQTPIKPYNAADKPAVRMKKSKPAEAAAGSGDEDEELTGPPQSPTSSPQQQSSSDGGSDLEELLGRDFPHEDLPSLITRAVGKGFSQLMMHTADTNEENLGSFLKLLDAALQHEVFTLEQKKLLFDWKQQCNQTLRVLTSKKNTRSGRHYVAAFTMPATPRGGQGSAYFPGNMATNKSRSLRGGMVRNGSMLTPSGGKGGLLPGPVRTSSTLPRMSARQLQRPIPHNTTPSFLRPNSTINFSPGSPIQAPPPPPSSGQQQVIGQSFQPQQIHVSSHLTSSATHTASSSSSSPFAAAVGHPPPLPPRTCEISETYMDDLCKRVTDHVLPDDLSDN